MAIIKDYNCSNAVLYQSARSSCSTCMQYQGDFINYKPKYTPAFFTTVQAEIDAAEKIKDIRVRNSIPKKTRIKMEKLARIICANWQDLKRYIIEAWPDLVMQEANLAEAGAFWYMDASNFVRTAVQNLINAGNLFLATYKADLEANDNMPATFISTFADAAKPFNELIGKYAAESKVKILTTDDKIMANNSVYAAIQLMLGDGRRIFAENPEKRKLFSFTYSVLHATGNGVGNLRGYVKDLVTGAIVPGVEATVVNKEFKPVSNAKGRYKIGRIAHGTYTITFSKPGYLPLTKEVTIKTATTTTLNVELMAA